MPFLLRDEYTAVYAGNSEDDEKVDEGISQKMNVHLVCPGQSGVNWSYQSDCQECPLFLLLLLIVK